jgi:hypothetical protein
LTSLGITRSAETKAGGSKGPLTPSVVNIGKVPVNNFRSCKPVELVANINQSLNRSDIDVVDSGEVEDDSLENGTIVVGGLLDVAGLTIIPGSILL